MKVKMHMYAHTPATLSIHTQRREIMVIISMGRTQRTCHVLCSELHTHIINPMLDQKKKSEAERFSHVSKL